MRAPCTATVRDACPGCGRQFELPAVPIDRANDLMGSLIDPCLRKDALISLRRARAEAALELPPKLRAQVTEQIDKAIALLAPGEDA